MTAPKALADLKLEREIALLDLQIEKEEGELIRIASTQRENHVMNFAAVVDPRAVSYGIETLTEWVRRDPEIPILIRLSSPGGYVLEGFGLFDVIRELVKKGASIETRVTGYAASMAGVLLQAGSVRSMSPHSYLMIHEAGSDTWGKTSEIRDDLAFLEKLEERCFKILADRSKLTVKQIRERSKRKDWWLDAAEARRHGFIDVVR